MTLIFSFFLYLSANPVGYFVIRMGFEPMTHSLEGCCSIQLSYQTNHPLPYSIHGECLFDAIWRTISCPPEKGKRDFSMFAGAKLRKIIKNEE